MYALLSLKYADLRNCVDCGSMLELPCGVRYETRGILVGYGEIGGDTARYSKIWWDMARYSEI